MFIHHQVLLVAQATLLVAQSSYVPAINYPATIEIDLLFPRNETYSSSHSIPVIFAIQNAASAWALGFDFDWSMSSTSNLSGVAPLGDAAVSTDNPPTGAAAIPPSDPYFIVNSTKPTHSWMVDVSPGSWTLVWSLNMPQALTESCKPGAWVAQGSIDFTIVEGSGGASLNFTDACPQAVGLVTVESYVKNCGVVLSSTVASANPCAASLSNLQASSVSAVLAQETASSGAQIRAESGLLLAAAGVPVFGALLL